MAYHPLDYLLIKDYIFVFDEAVHTRSDAADLSDELHDHLIEATDQLRASGLDLETAQRTSLQRLGEPDLIARMISAVPAKGSLMYAFFTRGTDFFTLAAAVLWAASAVAIPVTQPGVLPIWNPNTYSIAIVLITAAIAASSLALLAVHVRLTGRLDTLAVTVSVILALAVGSSFFVGWFFASWLILLTTATTMTLSRAWDTPVGAGVVGRILLIAWPLIALATLAGYLGMTSLGLTALSSSVDLYGAIALPILCLTYSAGMLALRPRLRTATPAEINRGPLITA